MMIIFYNFSKLLKPEKYQGSQSIGYMQGVQQLPMRRIILATGQHWNLDILVTRSSTMWDMLVKIPERFVHLDASYVYQSMDLTNDKPSDCEMSTILKDFKWELFPQPPYSSTLPSVTIICFRHWKTTASASCRKLNTTQKFCCSSRKWTHHSTISE